MICEKCGNKCDSGAKFCPQCGARIAHDSKIVPVGSTIIFGNYPQGIYGEEAPIEWQVLEKNNGKALLISEKALECRTYDTSYTDVTWENCTLRTWLNETFLNTAFNAEERSKILGTNVSADEDPEYSTNPGSCTTDKVFLLSGTEAEKYFSTDEDRKCVPTAYAKAQGACTSRFDTKGGEATCWWWLRLRLPGSNSNYAVCVFDVGSVGYIACGVNHDGGCVRPALWMTLDS